MKDKIQKIKAIDVNEVVELTKWIEKNIDYNDMPGLIASLAMTAYDNGPELVKSYAKEVLNKYPQKLKPKES